MVRSLAQLGGCFARQGDGEPGIKAIWQGYQRALFDRARPSGVPWMEVTPRPVALPLKQKTVS